MIGPEAPGGEPDRFARAARTKRERSSAAILDAAEALFEQDGYAATTVAAIATAAGVGLATLYSHHPTKAALADDLFRRHLDASGGAPGQASPEHAAPPDRQLRDHLVILTRAAARAPGVAEAVLQATAGPPTRAQRSKEWTTRSIPGEAALAEILRRGQRAGWLRHDVDADALARMLVITSLDQVVTDPGRQPDEVADRILSWVVVGITRAGAGPPG